VHDLSAELAQTRLELDAARAAENARHAEANAATAAAQAAEAQAALAAASDVAVMRTLCEGAAPGMSHARLSILRDNQLAVLCTEVAAWAAPVYAAVFALATMQTNSRNAGSTEHRDSSTGVEAAAQKAQDAMSKADIAMRQLDATRAAVRRALTAQHRYEHGQDAATAPAAMDDAAASGGSTASDVSAAATARDNTESVAALALEAAADACTALAAARRREEARAHSESEAVAAAQALACTLEDLTRTAETTELSASRQDAGFTSARTSMNIPDAMPVNTAAAMPALREIALHVLPASNATFGALETALQALLTEKAALIACAPRLAASLRSLCVAVESEQSNQGGVSPATTDGSCAASAAAAEALAAQHASSLRSLRRLATARTSAVSAVHDLPAAEERRLSALQALLDLSHERSTAQLKREWNMDREARYGALVAEHTAAVEAAEAAAENAAAALTSPAVREAYPELAASLRDVAANAALAGLQPSTGTAMSGDSIDSDAVSTLSSSTSSSTASRSAWDQVDVLQRTPRCAVLRVRPMNRPGAPHRVLKVFPHADSSFLAEARHLASARHPLVCELEAAYVEGGKAHLVLPFYSGGSARPWFEDLKRARGDLDPAQWHDVRRTFRQLLQALAFCHGRGIAHRDCKPENMLWRDESRQQLVLCDFGLSRDLARRLETTRHVSASGGGVTGGTPMYLAPEAASDDGSSVTSSARDWKECPWAVDCFSVGVMMVELACGEYVTWNPSARRLQPASPPPGRALPLPGHHTGGAAMGHFLALALALTNEQPDDRPSADEALLHPFFAESGANTAGPIQPVIAAVDGDGSISHAGNAADSAKLATVAALLGELRVAARATSRAVSQDGSTQGGCFEFAVAAAEAPQKMLSNIITAVCDASPAALAAPVWTASIGTARVPMSDLLRRAFTAAADPQAGLLHRADPSGPLLPTPGASGPACRALGRLLWRCVVEGVPCGVEWAPLVYAALLRRQDASLGDATTALAHWAAFDPPTAAAIRHRVALTRMASVRVDACNEAVTALWMPRRDALTSLADGFADANSSGDASSGAFAALWPAMQVLDEWQLGALLCGGAYVDVAAVRAALVWHDASWPAEDPTRKWLDECLASMPESNVRLFLARTTGRLTLDVSEEEATTTTILVTRMPQVEDASGGGAMHALPQFPGNGVLALPHSCPDSGTFTARLLAALGVQQPVNNNNAATNGVSSKTQPVVQTTPCTSCGAPVHIQPDAAAADGSAATLCAACDAAAASAAAAACCVCMTAKRSTLLLPCRHLCMCNSCATHVVERASARCPLCRVFIQARVMDCYL